jgi:hypothetical protein
MAGNLLVVVQRASPAEGTWTPPSGAQSPPMATVGLGDPVCAMEHEGPGGAAGPDVRRDECVVDGDLEPRVDGYADVGRTAIHERGDAHDELPVLGRLGYARDLAVGKRARAEKIRVWIALRASWQALS